MKYKSTEVSTFLDELKHPFRIEIENLREFILNSDVRITENIKWNGPNYCINNEDRITMRVQPPKQIQLIFHRGAKVQEIPKNRIIEDDSGLLIWKTSDRAVATFRNAGEIEQGKVNLTDIVKKWIQETTK
ncbi:MAG: DUF1801 domain-containing protein [Saprospiraceae bacterium]|nr:DUF1801 domain-containing protein [Candidatus Defluviibacterium haderslevense]